MFGKVFAQMFTGSMRGRGDLQLVFTYMLANASADGICDFTPQCISDATGMPLPHVETTLHELEGPDGMSRTRRDEGRRIRLLDEDRPWGWQIINHAYYRQIASREAMKEAERLRKREYRKSKKDDCPGHVRDRGGTAGSVSVSGSGLEGEGTGEGGFPKRMPADGWSWEQVIERASLVTVAVPADVARGFFDARTATGWVDAAGRAVAGTVAGLDADLRKWKVRAPSFGKTGETPEDFTRRCKAEMDAYRKEKGVK